MRTRVTLAALCVGLLLAGVALDRTLLPRPSPAVALAPNAAPNEFLAPNAAPSAFLASFNGLATVSRHLTGVKAARISQSTCHGLRVEHGIYTLTYHSHYWETTPAGYDEFKDSMRKIGDDIASQVAAGGGTTVCKCLGWGVEPSEWVYEVGGRRGVVTVLVLRLNQPSPTDLQANLAVVVQVSEY